ncbi:MurR/RpiR family transcriptional regulator [Sphingomonas oligophenolica]|uniref:MurR/RpiR family transcriptional regulator n=1 Tax=Sphingomonas oligophenolica TaxID=301154 RepID=A0ABU9YBS3_9SPHN
MTIDTLFAKIEKDYDSLPPRLRKVARYVIQNPTTVALSPLRKVASGAGVSSTTLIRLATTLGFDTYDDFREPFRDSLRPGSERYSGAATQIVDQRGDHGFEAVFARTGETIGAQITEVFQSVSAADVAAAGKALAKARRVYVLGLRSTFAAAFYFHYATRSFQDNIRLIDARHGMLLDEFLDIGEDDALLAISFDPYPTETVRSVSHAAERGATIVAITDNRLSPLAQRAQHVFIVPNVNSSFYTSLVPTLALLEALISFLLMEGGRPNVDKIKKRFALLELQGAYWSDRGDG